MTSIWLQHKLANVDKAEDLFELLQVAFDPHVLAVHRVHILRDFGAELRDLDLSTPTLTEQQRVDTCALTLRDVYQRFVAFSRGQGSCPSALTRIRWGLARRGSCGGGCSAMTVDRTME